MNHIKRRARTYTMPRGITIGMALLCCMLTTIVWANSPPNVESLNGKWLALADDDKSGETKAYQTTELAVDELASSDWLEVTVPCSFDVLGPHMKKFHGTCWFRRSFNVPKSWHGRRVVLHFAGVNNQAKVWING